MQGILISQLEMFDKMFAFTSVFGGKRLSANQLCLKFFFLYRNNYDVGSTLEYHRQEPL